MRYLIPWFWSLLLLTVAGYAGCQPAAVSSVPRVVTRSFPEADSVRSVADGADVAEGVKFQVISGPFGDLGYLAEMRCQAKSGSFLLQVVLDRNLVIENIAVRQYTAQRGSEIASSGFTRQFVGKSASDPIRLGRDIDAITGATVSSRSMAKATREILRAAPRLAAPVDGTRH